jgi:hypothetical protein
MGLLGTGKQLIGYLTIETKDNYFRGAALVTDQRGIPEDFRYTEPVRPTKLERILYGGALDIYLREDVILDNLLGAIDSKPLVWLVDSDELIKPVQKMTRLPAIAVETSQRPPLEHSGQYEPTTEKNVFIFQADNISAPLRLTVSGDNAERMAQLVQTLHTAAADMELMEPFTRMAKAIEAIAETEA